MKTSCLNHVVQEPILLIQFGMNLGFTYKNFDLNILLQGAAGYVIGYANDDVFGIRCARQINPTLIAEVCRSLASSKRN